MYLTGFADEAASGLAGQIKATQALGWNAIESRAIDGQNIHDISDQAFDQVCAQLSEAGVRINCFGSTIANWGKNIEDPFDITLAEVERAIPRMQRLGTQLIRIMSYARRDDDDQMEAERFRRLSEICKRFLDAGLTPVHENCMNYGGMSYQHTLKLLEAVPNLKLVYDTGNPAISRDYSAGGDALQDPWEFYKNVRPYIAYIHIKDAVLDDGEEVFLYPGEGGARIPDILWDLKETDYDGGISIEPHMAAVFHNPDAVQASAQESFDIYVTYGEKLMGLLKDIDFNWKLYEVHGKAA